MSVFARAYIYTSNNTYPHDRNQNHMVPYRCFKFYSWSDRSPLGFYHGCIPSLRTFPNPTHEWNQYIRMLASILATWERNTRTPKHHGVSNSDTIVTNRSCKNLCSCFIIALMDRLSFCFWIFLSLKRETHRQFYRLGPLKPAKLLVREPDKSRWRPNPREILNFFIFRKTWSSNAQEGF